MGEILNQLLERKEAEQEAERRMFGGGPQSDANQPKIKEPTTKDLIITVLIVAAALVTVFLSGIHIGREHERARQEHICSQVSLLVYGLQTNGKIGTAAGDLLKFLACQRQ